MDSDRSTTLLAALNRGVWHGADEWRDLFLPSADLHVEKPMLSCGPTWSCPAEACRNGDRGGDHERRDGHH